MSRDRSLTLFTKPALAGRVKTRLIGDLTPEQAAELHGAFRDDLVERLRPAPVLAPLSDEDFNELASAARSVTYRVGEFILEPGSVDRDSYIMWQGRARIVATAHEGRYIDLGPGDLFGAMSRPNLEEESPGVVALTDCEVVVVDADTAGAVASRNPTVIEALNKIITLRNRRFEPEVGEVSVAMFGVEAQQEAPEGDGEHGDGGSGA